MCNINLYFKTTVYSGDRLNQLLALITSTTGNSFITNDDGEGFYFDTGVLTKSVNKVNPLEFSNEIANSKLILTHQRWATHGNSDYVQPFENADFVVAHNGVLSTYVDNTNGHSDTYNMFSKFYTAFATSTKTTRQAKVVQAIKETFDDVSGSFSVIIYDKIDKISYYFKDDGTKMKAYVNKSRSFMYMTTCADNEKLLPLMGEEFFIRDINDYTIYEIKIEEKVYAKGIAKIKEKVYANVSYCTGFSSSGGYNAYGHNYSSNYGLTSARTSSRATDVLEDKTEETKKPNKQQEPTGLNKVVPKEVTRLNAENLGLDGVREASECVYCGQKTHWCACDLDIFICPICMDCDFEEIFDELSVIRSGAEGEEYDVLEYNKGFKVKEEDKVRIQRGVDESI